jgi:quercetin dioxygenase-like cupin family protein
MSQDDCERTALLGPRLPPSFVRREVVVAPGGERPFREADWSDSLVIVARGEIDLQCHAGGRTRFVRGDILWLTGLPLRALRNPGREPTVLVAVSRA